MKAVRIILLMLLGLCFYTTWVVWPHIVEPDLVNKAGLTNADIKLITIKIMSGDHFYGRREISTVGTTFINPKSRPRYYMEIEGNEVEVYITTGYHRGPLWAGGTKLKATKNGGKWYIEDKGIIWRS